MELKLPPFHTFGLEQSSLYAYMQPYIKGIEPSYPDVKKSPPITNGYNYELDNFVRYYSPSSDDCDKTPNHNSSILTLNRKVSKNCTHFFNHSSCKRGIFCLYMHNNSHQHLYHEICPDLMKGRCTKLNQCKKSHTLFEHQMPVCSLFLKKKCNSRQCIYGYLHVKHSYNTKCCENFNSGLCNNGEKCEYLHVYQDDLIKRRAM
uniref:C3H1-type domain-containing protein n=1 Tax=Parastrongyloides trichosuri TaxID=131310 RepID=A0A0N4ZA55_PARTI